MRFNSDDCGEWTEIFVEFNRGDVWMFLKALLRGSCVLKFFCRPVGGKRGNLAVAGVQIIPKQKDSK